MLKASRERAGTIGFFLLLRALSLATPSPPRYRAAFEPLLLLELREEITRGLHP